MDFTGANFLKKEAKELLMSEDENSSDTVPKIVSTEPTKVRSILKGSASGPKNSPKTSPKKNLRAAIAIRDEKRIQFDITEEKKALVMDIPDEVKYTIFTFL